MQQSLRCCAAFLNCKSLRIRDPSCIEFGNEFWGFPVNAGFSYPTVSVFITRTYSSPIIAWFVPCVVPAGWTAGLENAEYKGERWLLLPVVPCHGSFSMLYAHHAMKSWIYRHRSQRMMTPPRFLTAPLKWMVEIDWNDLVQLGYHGGKTWTRHKCYCPLLLYLTTPVSFGASSPNLLMVPFTLLPLKTRLLNSPDYDESFHCFISMWWVWCAPENFIWW